jgi:hypothetical protein
MATNEKISLKLYLISRRAPSRFKWLHQRLVKTK